MQLNSHFDFKHHKEFLSFKQVGEWVFREGQIGEGTFGTVRLAKHKKFKTTAAIKLLNKRFIEQCDCEEYLFNEIHALDKLSQHKTILKIYEVIEDESNVAIVTEYVPGGTLLQRILSKAYLPEEEAKTIFYDIVCAMDFAHQNNFLHRDLKCENIFMTKKNGGSPKIGDWGFASIRNPGEKLTQDCGSVHYSSPEICQGREYDESTDTWSLGIMLVVMTTGSFPFFSTSSRNIQEVQRRICSGVYELPNFLSPNLVSLISQMLQTDPTNRLSLQRVLQHPWLSSLHKERKRGIVRNFGVLKFLKKKIIS